MVPVDAVCRLAARLPGPAGGIIVETSFYAELGRPERSLPLIQGDAGAAGNGEAAGRGPSAAWPAMTAKIPGIA